MSHAMAEVEGCGAGDMGAEGSKDSEDGGGVPTLRGAAEASSDRESGADADVPEAVGGERWGVEKEEWG